MYKMLFKRIYYDKEVADLESKERRILLKHIRLQAKSYEYIYRKGIERNETSFS